MTSLYTSSSLEGDLTSFDTIQKFLPGFKDAVLDISDFEPMRIVGQGGFATVYKCLQKSTQQVVAVKVLKERHLKYEQSIYDFLLEAQLMHKLRHPLVVEFKGICFGKLDDPFAAESICVVTEFMESGTLKDWIQAQTNDPTKTVYTQRTALKWILQIAEVVDYLHSRKFSIIHRDLKPENILLRPDPRNPREYIPKIADFGLSVIVASKMKQIDEANPFDTLEAVDSDALPELLKHGKQRKPKNARNLKKALAEASFAIRSDSERVFNGKRSESNKYLMTGHTGSLLYMAPEVLKNEMYNEKVDVFSFGTIIYETLKKYRLSVKLKEEQSCNYVQRYAANVKDGIRLPIPNEWPTELRDLIRSCWEGKKQFQFILIACF